MNHLIAPFNQSEPNIYFIIIEMQTRNLTLIANFYGSELITYLSIHYVPLGLLIKLKVLLHYLILVVPEMNRTTLRYQNAHYVVSYFSA